MTRCALALVMAVACSSAKVQPLQLKVSPPQLDFGSQPPTARTTRTVSIKNDGSAELQLAGAVLQGDARHTFAAGLLPLTLAAGASIDYAVTYSAPPSAGSDTATLVLREVGNATGVEVALSARAADAQCNDGFKNGDEADVDCGGAHCPGCGAGAQCGAAHDCGGGLGCVGGRCGACTGAGDCSAGQECSASGVCVGCRNDADCTAGSTCVSGACQTCASAHGGTLDTQTDVNNCGACGHVCATPVHASAACSAGQCGRGACEAGWFDFGGSGAFGCATSCTGSACTDGSGNPIAVTSPPLPESGNVFHSLSSGSSFGGGAQTSASYTNEGALSEATPPARNGSVSQNGTHYQNTGGFKAALH